MFFSLHRLPRYTISSFSRYIDFSSYRIGRCFILFPLLAVGRAVSVAPPAVVASGVAEQGIVREPLDQAKEHVVQG